MREQKQTLSCAGKVGLIVLSAVMTALIPAGGFLTGLFGSSDTKVIQEEKNNSQYFNLLFPYSAGNNNFMTFVLRFNLENKEYKITRLYEYSGKPHFEMFDKYKDIIYTRYYEGSMFKFNNQNFNYEIVVVESGLSIRKYTLCNDGTLLASGKENSYYLQPLHSTDLGKTTVSYLIYQPGSKTLINVKDVAFNKDECNALVIGLNGIYYSSNLIRQVTKISDIISGNRVYNLGDNYIVIYKSGHLLEKPAAIFYSKNNTYIEFGNNLYKDIIFFDCIKIKQFDDPLCLLLNSTERNPIVYKLASIHPQRGPIYWDLPLSGVWQKMIPVIHPNNPNKIILIIYSNGRSKTILIRENGIKSKNYTIINPELNYLHKPITFFN